MFFWPTAAKEPSAMEAIATKTMIWRQSPMSGRKVSEVRRMRIAMAAIFGPAAKKAVTGVGAPS
ncbi:hypothetical protein D3C87_1623780 [compost metagenome]